MPTKKQTQSNKDSRRDSIFKNWQTQFKSIYSSRSRDDRDVGILIQAHAEKIAELMTLARAARFKPDLLNIKFRLVAIKTKSREEILAINPDSMKLLERLVDLSVSTISKFLPETSSESINQVLSATGKAVGTQIDKLTSYMSSNFSPGAMIRSASGLNPLVSMGVDFVENAISREREKRQEFKQTKKVDIDIDEILERVSVLKQKDEERKAEHEKAEKIRERILRREEKRKLREAEKVKAAKSAFWNKTDSAEFGYSVGQSGSGQAPVFPNKAMDLLDKIETDLVTIYDTTANSEKLLIRISDYTKRSADASEQLVRVQKENDQEEYLNRFREQENLFESLDNMAVLQQKNTEVQANKSKYDNPIKKVLDSTMVDDIVVGNFITKILSRPLGWMFGGAILTKMSGLFNKGILTKIFGTIASSGVLTKFLPWTLIITSISTVLYELVRTTKAFIRDARMLADKMGGSIKNAILLTFSSFFGVIGQILQYIPGMRDLGDKLKGIDVAVKKGGHRHAALLMSMGEEGDELFRDYGRTGEIGTLNKKLNNDLNTLNNIPEYQREQFSSDAINKWSKLSESLTGPTSPFKEKVNNSNVTRDTKLSQYDQYFDEAYQETGIPQAVLKGIAMRESSGGINLIGDGGKAVGIMQLHSDAAREGGIDPSERMDHRKSILAAARHLRLKMVEWNYDLESALAAYNQGTTGMKEGSPERQSKGRLYAKDVLQRSESFIPKRGDQIENKQTEVARLKDSQQNKQFAALRNVNNISSSGNNSPQISTHTYNNTGAETAGVINAWTFGIPNPVAYRT